MRIRQAVKTWGWIVACACVAAYAQAVRVPDGTQVRVRLTADLLSSQAAVGARVDMEISQPVVSQGVTVIPAGAVVWGAVQEAKKGKVLNFDVEGVRVPNLGIVKLRVSQHKTTSAGKDEIKVVTQVGADLVAEKGSEYTAYLDQDIEAAGVPAAPAAPSQPAPVTAPKPVPQPETTAPVTAPVPVAAPTATPQPEAPPSTPAPPTPSPAPPATIAATAVQPGERITVECFSEPLGADILIDDEFHGSTPSILKIQPGDHRIEYRMIGYKPHSQPLTLKSGDSLTTVRVTMEKQP